MKESSISRERARAILAAAGQAEDYDPQGDYWVCTDSDGREWLTCWGMDQPMIENHTSMSWLGSVTECEVPDTGGQDMSETTSCRCGAPATTEIGRGWSHGTGPVPGEPVCEACWGESEEGLRCRRESAVRRAETRLGIGHFAGGYDGPPPEVLAEARRIDPEAFAG
jgi:hypothetical protein